MQQKLIEFCNWLEPRIRPLGWHCGATGSALYGQTGQEPEDMDVLLYRHNGFEGTKWRAFDVLLAAGLRKIDDCTEYPEFEEGNTKDSNPRKVFKVIINGVKIDFLCLEKS